MMATILGIDPGIQYTAVVSIRAEPGQSPFLLDRLLICKRNLSLNTQQNQGDESVVDRISKIWYRVREFAFLQEPTMIAIEKFSWIAHEEDRGGDTVQCPRCTHPIPLPKGEKGVSPDCEEMYRLIGALGTLSEIAPIVEIRPADWRIALTGHPMPKRRRIDGTLTRTGWEHHVRKSVYERLGLNGGDNLSVHEVDAAGIALCVAAEHIGINSLEESILALR